MNYSKPIKKKSLAKRIIISWLIVGFVFSLIGVGVGLLIPVGNTSAAEPDNTPEVIIYGTPEGKIYKTGLQQTYEQESDFVFTNAVPATFDENLQEFTYYLSTAYEIDYSLVLAIIQKESGFVPDIVSPTNDFGLMQINACNHEYLTNEIGVTDFVDPYQNIKAGMFILRGLFDKYDSTSKVLMAYNMGESGASKLWEQGVLESNYSRSILEIQQEINNELEGRLNHD